MKIGLDFHGVISHDPIMFLIMAKELMGQPGDPSNEVHIITGGMWSSMKPKLEKLGFILGVTYSHFYSISDAMMADEHDVTFEDEDNPMFNVEAWNIQKGIYASKYKLDLHYDDSDEYHKFFPRKTNYIHYDKGNLKLLTDRKMLHHCMICNRKFNVATS